MAKGGRIKPRPKRLVSPAPRKPGRFQPKPKKPPKVLPPRRPRGTAPRLPSMKDLTPEQRKKVLQLIRGMRKK